MKPGASGWSTVLVRPEAAHTAVPSASASIESHRGTVAAAWVRSSDSFVLNVSIPHGSSAEVHVPKVFAGGTVVTEGGTVVSGRAGDAATGASDGVVQTGEDERWVRFSTLSGRYSFAATSHFNGARLVAPEDRHTQQQEAAMKNDDCPRTELRRECLQWRPSQLFGLNQWLPTPIHNQTFTRRLANEFPGGDPLSQLNSSLHSYEAAGVNTSSLAFLLPWYGCTFRVNETLGFSVCVASIYYMLYL